jgi:hypothetical protein
MTVASIDAGSHLTSMSDAGFPWRAAAPPRVLLDLSTSLAWRGGHAVGIVQTERELARHLMGDASLCTGPVVYHDNAFRALEPDLARALIDPAGERRPIMARGRLRQGWARQGLPCCCGRWHGWCAAPRTGCSARCRSRPVATRGKL